MRRVLVKEQSSRVKIIIEVKSSILADCTVIVTRECVKKNMVALSLLVHRDPRSHNHFFPPHSKAPRLVIKHVNNAPDSTVAAAVITSPWVSNPDHADHMSSDQYRLILCYLMGSPRSSRTRSRNPPRRTYQGFRVLNGQTLRSQVDHSHHGPNI